MKNVVIVGGSKGIGQSIVSQLIQKGGYHIHNISRTAGIEQENVSQYFCDILTDELPKIEDINSLIYCPGSIMLKPISSLKLEDFRQDLEINVIGAIKAIKAYQKNLAKSQNASIILFSTVAVAQGMPFHSSVSAAKGAIEGVTRSLAAELAPKIRVNCIAPTITDTPLAANLLRNEAARVKMSERHPLKRILDPEDLSEMACYLISTKAKAITGQVMRIDAGMSTIKI